NQVVTLNWNWVVNITGICNLTTYLYTGDQKEWASFLEEIEVPKGDGAARIALIENKSEEEIKSALRLGRNKEEDLDDIIWLYKNFKSVSFFTQAMQEWSTGDILIEQLNRIGYEIHQK